MRIRPTVFLVDAGGESRELVSRAANLDGLSVECFGSAEEFTASYDPSRPGCLLLDIGTAGPEAVEWLTDQGTRVPVVVIGNNADVQTAIRVMKAGAMDFVEAPVDPADLLDRIWRAIERDGELRRDQARRERILARWERLTPREREVMERVVAGATNRQIASDLGISTKTVEVYRANGMRKMEADSLVDLVRMVLSAGFGAIQGGKRYGPLREALKPDRSRSSTRPS